MSVMRIPGLFFKYGSVPLFYKLTLSRFWGFDAREVFLLSYLYFISTMFFCLQYYSGEGRAELCMFEKRHRKEREREIYIYMYKRCTIQYQFFC